MDLLVEIEAILPQTQCGQCGFNACKPYAQALVEENAEINLCPPGDTNGIKKLADLLNKPFIPFTSERYPQPQTRAMIDEKNCIGCTHCIRACPVDAIIGSAKKMHTILADACTGCALCLPPCPVDCIEMQSLTQLQQAQEAQLTTIQKKQRALQYKTRYEYKQNRIELHQRNLTNRRAKRLQDTAQKSLTTSYETQATSSDKKDLLTQILAKAAKNKPTEHQNQMYQQQQQNKIDQDVSKAAKRQKRAYYTKLNKQK